MNHRRITDIFQIDSPLTLWGEVNKILPLISPGVQTDSLHRIFNSVNNLYHGNYPGYSLIHGAAIDGAVFSASDVVAGLTAAILHDAGYIQEVDDREGTGAKHKAIHERRSMEFLSRHGKSFGLSAEEISAGRSIIRCTDMQTDIESISFASRQIKLLGKLLAAADLLAQLSDPLYLEKLLYLYHECREAGTGNYTTEADILIKAPPFYDVFEDRLKLLMIKTDRYLKLHFASRSHGDEDLYRVAIEKHKHYLENILSSKDADPYNHLRRGGIVETVRRQTTINN